MGLRGPQKRSASDSKARGNPGKRGKSKDEPVIAVDLPPEMPAKPAWLTKEARAYWDTIAPDLFAAGLLHKIDAAIFGRLCQLAGAAIALEKKLKGVYTFRSPNGHICKRPEVNIIRDCWRDYGALAPKFGLTPQARRSQNVKLAAPKAQDAQAVALAEKKAKILGR